MTDETIAEALPEQTPEEKVEILTELLAASQDEVQLWQTRAIGYMNESSQAVLEKKALERRVARLQQQLAAVAMVAGNDGPQSTEPSILTPEKNNGDLDPQAAERTAGGSAEGSGGGGEGQAPDAADQPA